MKRKKKRTRMKMEIRSNSKHNADGRRVNNTEEGEKLSREFFFFFRANELTVHSMYSVDRNLVIWSRDNKSCRRYARSSSCSSFLGCRLNTPGVIASKYFWKRQLRDRGMRRGFVRHEKNSFSLFLPSNSPF